MSGLRNIKFNLTDARSSSCNLMKTQIYRFIGIGKVDSEFSHSSDYRH